MNGGAAFDQYLSKLGARVYKCDDLFSEIGQWLGVGERLQLQEVVDRVFLIGAVEVDIYG